MPRSVTTWVCSAYNKVYTAKGSVIVNRKGMATAYGCTELPDSLSHGKPLPIVGVQCGLGHNFRPSVALSASTDASG